MLKVSFDGGLSIPVLVCDICGHLIEDVELAAVVYKSSLSLNIDGHMTEAFCVHKRDCLDKAEANLGGKAAVGWVELSVHLSRLLHNIGLSLDKMRRLDDVEKKFGSL